MCSGDEQMELICIAPPSMSRNTAIVLTTICLCGMSVSLPFFLFAGNVLIQEITGAKMLPFISDQTGLSTWDLFVTVVVLICSTTMVLIWPCIFASEISESFTVTSFHAQITEMGPQALTISRKPSFFRRREIIPFSRLEHLQIELVGKSRGSARITTFNKIVAVICPVGGGPMKEKILYSTDGSLAFEGVVNSLCAHPIIKCLRNPICD